MYKLYELFFYLKKQQKKLIINKAHFQPNISILEQNKKKHTHVGTCIYLTRRYYMLFY